MKRKIGTQLEDEVYQDLKMAAAQERRPISEVIQVAVTDYLNQKKLKTLMLILLNLRKGKKNWKKNLQEQNSSRRNQE